MDALLGKSALEDDAILRYTPNEYSYGYDGILDLEHHNAEDQFSSDGMGLGIGTGMDVGIGSISLGHHGYATKSPSLSSYRSSLSTGLAGHSDNNGPARQVEIEIRRQSDPSDTSDIVSFGVRVRRPQSSGDGSDNANTSEEKFVTLRVRKSATSVTDRSGSALFADRDEEECSSRRSRTASPVPSLSSSSSTARSSSASPSMSTSSLLGNTSTKSMGQITVQLKQALDASGDNMDLDLASVLGLGAGGVLGIEDESIGSWEVVLS